MLDSLESGLSEIGAVRLWWSDMQPFQVVVDVVESGIASGSLVLRYFAQKLMTLKGQYTTDIKKFN